MSYNNEMKRKIKMIQRIQIVKGFANHAFTGYGNMTYIKITLKEIKLSKELFVLQVQQGEEVFIPGRLSLRSHALCYQFYDPIFQIIEELSTNEKKNLMSQKNKMNLKMAQ